MFRMLERNVEGPYHRTLQWERHQVWRQHGQSATTKNTKYPFGHHSELNAFWSEQGHRTTKHISVSWRFLYPHPATDFLTERVKRWGWIPDFTCRAHRHFNARVTIAPFCFRYLTIPLWNWQRWEQMSLLIRDFSFSAPVSPLMKFHNPSEKYVSNVEITLKSARLLNRIE